MQITIWRQLGGMGYIGNPFFTGLRENGLASRIPFPGIGEMEVHREPFLACIREMGFVANHYLVEIRENGLHWECYWARIRLNGLGCIVNLYLAGLRENGLASQITL